MSYSRFYKTKAERETFRRHLPVWVEVDLRFPPKVYLRLGNQIHFWTLDVVNSFHHGRRQTTLRGSTRWERAAYDLGRRFS